MKNTTGHITGAAMIVLVILAGALVLRLHNLNKYDLWFDELATEMFTAQDLAATTDLSKVSRSSLILDRMRHDPHSSLYYLAVYAYSLLFGDGKSLRLLSVLFSMLSLGMFYKLSRIFFNRHVSIYALLIMAASPFHLWYAQEARAYAMTCFFSLAAVYACMQALKTGKRIYWICFPAAGVLAVHSSYNAVLLLAVTGTALLFKDYRRHTGKWFLSLTAVGIVALLLQSVSIAQLSVVKNGFWIPVPSKIALLCTWMFFTLGYSAHLIQYQTALFLFYLLFVYGACTCYRSDRTHTVILLLFLFFPVMATYILSKFVVPVYLYRQLLIFSPFYYLFVANGIAGITNQRVRILTVLCIGAVMTAPVVNYYRGNMFAERFYRDLLPGVYPKRNYSDLMARLSDKYQEGDLIAAVDIQAYVITRSYIARHHEKYNDPPFKMFCYLSYPVILRSYEKNVLAVDGLVAGISPGDLYALHGFALLPNGKMGMRKMQLDKDEFRRVWLVSASWMKDYPVFLEAEWVKQHMGGHFKEALLMKKDGIQIGLYTRI